MDMSSMKTLSKGMRNGSATTIKFLNFWSQYCRSHYNLDMMQCTKKAITLWKGLDRNEKSNYSTKLLASDFNWIDSKSQSNASRKIPRKKAAPRKPVGPRLKLQKGSVSTLKRKRTINQHSSSNYLNFLRYFKEKHNDLESEDLITKAAEAWSSMSKKEKDSYCRREETNCPSPGENQL